MKHLKLYENFENGYTISDFPYVVEYFKKFGKEVSDIPVYIISEEDWSDGKSRGTENDRKGGIRIHENQVKNDSEIGWLIHEVGHVLDLRGETMDYLVPEEEFSGYPNADDEQTPMWYQFKYLLSKGLSEEQVIKLLKDSYSDSKGDSGTWEQPPGYKNRFFRAYYQKISQI
jgi:hypothetical protein